MKTNTALKAQLVRAAIYARRSTDDDRTSEDGRSVDRQVALARAFCQKQVWSVAEPWVITEEKSGADFTRVGLVRLLEGARLKQFDVVVVMSIDRIGREQVRTQGVVQQLHAAGVAVWTYQSGQRVEFGTPTQKLMLGVSSFAAEEYRFAVKLKTTEALRRKAGLGHQVSGSTFGYSLVRVGDHTEKQIDPEQEVVVRQIFEMSASGLGDGRVVNKLSADRAPSGGRTWSKKIVCTILRNELYVGRAVYGRTMTVDDGARGRRVRVADESLWTVAQVPHLRIVTDDLWERVQRRRAQTRLHYLRDDAGRLRGKPESALVARHLLNGVARCGACGGTMLHMGTPRNRRNRYYCTTRNRRGPAGCSLGSGAPMRELDEAVLDQLYQTLVRKPAVVAALCEERVARLRREQADALRPSSEREVARLEAEVGRLVRAIATGRASADVVAAIEERRAKIEQLSAPAPEPVKFDRAQFYNEMRTISGVWDVVALMNPSHTLMIRQMLRRLGVDRVTVHRADDGTWSFESALDVGRLIKIGPAASSGESVTCSRCSSPGSMVPSTSSRLRTKSVSGRQYSRPMSTMGNSSTLPVCTSVAISNISSSVPKPPGSAMKA